MTTNLEAVADELLQEEHGLPLAQQRVLHRLLLVQHGPRRRVHLRRRHVVHPSGRVHGGRGGRRGRRVLLEEGGEVVELGHDPVDLLWVDGGGEGAVLGAGDDEGGQPDGPHQAREVEVEPVVLEREVHLLWEKKG